MNDEPKEQKLTVRFPFQLLESIRKLAAKHERSVNGEIIWALRRYVAEHYGNNDGIS